MLPSEFKVASRSSSRPCGQHQMAMLQKLKWWGTIQLHATLWGASASWEWGRLCLAVGSMTWWRRTTSLWPFCISARDSSTSLRAEAIEHQCLLSCSLVACSYCFLLPSRTICLRMAQPMVIWVLPHHTPIKKMPYWFTYRPTQCRKSLIDTFFPSDEGCANLTN